MKGLIRILVIFIAGCFVSAQTYTRICESDPIILSSNREEAAVVRRLAVRSGDQAANWHQSVDLDASIDLDPLRFHPVGALVLAGALGLNGGNEGFQTKEAHSDRRGAHGAFPVRIFLAPESNNSQVLPSQDTLVADGFVSSFGLFCIGLKLPHAWANTYGGKRARVFLAYAELEKGSAIWRDDLAASSRDLGIVFVPPVGEMSLDSFKSDWNVQGKTLWHPWQAGANIERIWSVEGPLIEFGWQLEKGLTRGPDVPLAADHILGGATDEEYVNQLIDRFEELDGRSLWQVRSIVANAFEPPGDVKGPRGRSYHGTFDNRGLEAIRKIIRIGPRAIPFLVRRLRDRTKTLASVGSDWTTVSMRDEYSGNPFNSEERGAWGHALLMRGLSTKELPAAGRYIFTVSDIAMFSLLAITNRSCVVDSLLGRSQTTVPWPLTSTSTKQKMIDIWSQPDVQKHLWRWLSTDFALKGSGVEEFVFGAMTRMSFYYPQNAEQLFAMAPELVSNSRK